MIHARRLIFLVLAALLAPPAFATSYGNYWRHPVPGFGAKWNRAAHRFEDQSGFDEVGRLEGCASPPPGRLFRGGAPDLSPGSPALQTLKDNHIGWVIDLREEDPAWSAPGDSHAKALEENTLAANGIGYVNLALSTEFARDGALPRKVRLRVRPPGNGSVATDEWVDPVVGVQALIALVRERLASNSADASGTFVHCMHGSDRTGMFIGLLRGCENEWKPELKAYWGTAYPALRALREQVQARNAVEESRSLLSELERLSSARASCAAVPEAAAFKRERGERSRSTNLRDLSPGS